MPNTDRCFGLGGSFSITPYDVSEKNADHKVNAIMAIGFPNQECGIIAGGQDRRDRERTRHSSPPPVESNLRRRRTPVQVSQDLAGANSKISLGDPSSLANARKAKRGVFENLPSRHFSRLTGNPTGMWGG